MKTKKLKCIIFAVFFFGVFGLAKVSLAERFFQQNSTWYEKIPTNPVLIDYNAEFMIALRSYYTGLVIYGSGASNPSLKNGDSVPIFRAVESTPLTNIQSDSCHPTHPEWCANIPIPSEARGARNDEACLGTYADGHLSIISADSAYLWELYHARKCETLGDGIGDEDKICDAGETCYWYSYITRKWILSGTGVNQPYDGFYATRVSKVPHTHGVVTYNEVVNDKVINHAIAMYTAARYSTSSPQTYKDTISWYPTYMSSGFNNGAYATTYGLHLGMRLQLNPTYNCSGLSNEMARIVCVALQEYGMIYVENTGWSGGNGIYIENLAYDSRTWYGTAPGLLGIDINNFRIVEPVCSDPYWCPDNYIASQPDTTPPAAPTGVRAN
jgi:hypothetical protein